MLCAVSSLGNWFRSGVISPVTGDLLSYRDLLEPCSCCYFLNRCELPNVNEWITVSQNLFCNLMLVNFMENAENLF